MSVSALSSGSFYGKMTLMNKKITLNLCELTSTNTTFLDGMTKMNSDTSYMTIAGIEKQRNTTLSRMGNVQVLETSSVAKIPKGEIKGLTLEFVYTSTGATVEFYFKGNGVLQTPSGTMNLASSIFNFDAHGLRVDLDAVTRIFAYREFGCKIFPSQTGQHDNDVLRALNNHAKLRNYV